MALLDPGLFTETFPQPLRLIGPSHLVRLWGMQLHQCFWKSAKKYINKRTVHFPMPSFVKDRVMGVIPIPYYLSMPFEPIINGKRRIIPA